MQPAVLPTCPTPIRRPDHTAPAGSAPGTEPRAIPSRDASTRFQSSASRAARWLGPLANADTLVMTAADADHTSYGCGRGSELTYFGRAMYAEALQTTWSFEQAHASARSVIDQRERAAGKADGYSNPQILAGEAIRRKLEQLVAHRSKLH